MSHFKRIKQMPGCAAKVLALGTRMLGSTLRLEVDDPDGFLETDPPEPCILSIWHNRLLCMPMVLPLHVRERCAALVSRSRDGGYICDFLKCFGVGSIRGSSSRGGAESLRDMQRFLIDGGVLGLTPDGPRGPRYEVQDGICWLASRAQVPIRPVAVNSRSHWELNNWDGTQIPKPFTRARLVIGNPIRIAPELDNDGLAACKQLVKQKMAEATAWDQA